MADIAGSSRLWNRHPERMSAALARHDAIAEQSVSGHRGTIFKHTGDGFLAVFVDVAGALDAMRDYQLALDAEAWPEPISVRSRVAVHHGDAQERDGDWFGPTINHLARFTDMVEPTHIVASEAALTALGSGFSASALVPLGAFSVRDIPDAIPLHSLPLATSIGPALTVASGQGLPDFETSFVGREESVAQLLDLVERERLVTVLGFGGMGKTRIATEVGRQWATRHAAPAFFVDLTSSPDPDEALIEALGMPAAVLGEGEQRFAAVAKHLGSGPALVVVDNCEHVIDAAAEVCEALRDQVETIRVVATSREPLELDGEAIHQLSALEADAALGMLIDRAATAGLTDLDPDAARRICVAVDSMPLGVELAVARLRHVPALELADALERDLGALRGRRRSRGRSASGNGRHATLHSMIEWSIELLDEEEHELLLRLSQFSAPFRRSDAAALMPEADPDLIEELVAKSLVAADRGGRFRILASVRQFCASALDDDADRQTVASDALVEWARSVAPPIRSAAGLVFDTQRARELNHVAANLREALDRAHTLGRHLAEAEIMTGLWPLSVDGRSREWFDQRAVAVLDQPIDDPELRAILVRIALQAQLGDNANPEAELQLIGTLEEIDPAHASPIWGVVTSTGAVRKILVNRIIGGDPEEPRGELAEAIELAATTEHTMDEALAELFLSYSYLLNDDPGRATEISEKAADRARTCHFEQLVALADATSALAMSFAGQSDLALDIARSAVPFAANARWESSVRAIEALLLIWNGAEDEAQAATAELIRQVLDDGSPFLLFDAVVVVAALEAERRNFDAARSALDLLSVSRTPLTVAAMMRIAETVEFDLGVDRFLDSFDPQKFALRGEKAAAFLEQQQLLLTGS